MALHSTVFSPAKYGIVPEMLPDKDLSRANALLEMSTFVAIVLGTSIGSFLFTLGKNQPWKMGLAMLAVAVAGFLASLRITRVPAPRRRAPFRFNPFAEVDHGHASTCWRTGVWLTVVGISYFWFLGALFQMDLLLFGSEVLHVRRSAGRADGDRARGGDRRGQPAGRATVRRQSRAGPGAARLALDGSFLHRSVRRARLLRLVSGDRSSLLGLASGLFIVPLNAFLQQRSEKPAKKAA